MSRGARQQAKAASREALLRAGIELFAESGLDAPSLDAICARAGYTRGAFYVHFADREAFLEAVLVRVLDGYVATIVSTGDAGDLEATVRAFFAALAPAPGGGPPDPLSPAGASIHLRLLLDGCARSDKVRAAFVQGFETAADTLDGVIRSAQAAGAVRADLDAPVAARMLVVQVLGLLAARQTGVPVDAAAGVATLLQLALPTTAP